MIDVYSRAILGYAIYVGKKRELPACAIHALRYAISPKNDKKYPMYGLIGTLVTDSGAGYKNADYTYFASKIADTRLVAPPYEAWCKPFVERFIGTARTQLFSNLDGYVGKYDPDRFNDESIRENACYTVDQFREIFHSFIVDHYHHTPHKGLKGRTPFEVWNEGIKDRPPILPKNLGDLSRLRGVRETRTLTRTHGVTYQYQRFHSRELQELYDVAAQANKKKGKVKIDIRVDPLDAGAITAINPVNGEEIEVGNVNVDAAERSFEELNAWRGSARRDDAPVFCPEPPREPPRSRKPRRGPEVDLDSEATPIDLDSLDPRGKPQTPDSADNEFPVTRLPNDEPDDDDDGMDYAVE